MVWHAVQKWVYAYGLSACCIVAPVVLGFGALVLTAYLLTRPADRLPLTYEFLSETDLSGSSTATGKQIAEKNVPHLAMTFVAKDLRGRVSYAVASAFLYLAAATAIGFGFWVVRRRVRARIAFEALLFFFFLGWIVASFPFAFDLLRPLVVEHILAAANKQAPPMNFLASGDADHSWFNPFVRFFFHDVDQFDDTAVTGLVRLNSMIGLIAVGMLLAALASASVRPENPPVRRDIAAWLSKWQGKYPKLCAWVEENIEETLSYYRLPLPHHKHMKSTNMLERLNQEIKRRTHVVRIFPNAASCLRLVRALAVETHENWLEAMRYPNMDHLKEHRQELLRQAA